MSDIRLTQQLPRYLRRLHSAPGHLTAVNSPTFYNITSIQLSRALPGASVTVSAGQGANTVLATLSGYSTTSSTANTASQNAIDYNSFTAASNSLAITFTGNTAGMSNANPLKISITGNVVTTRATASVEAASTTTTTQNAIFNSLTDNNVASLVGNFYSITGLSFSGGVPSENGLLASVKETYANTIIGEGAVQGTNSITGNGVLTVTATAASPGVLYTQTGQVYQSPRLRLSANVIYNQQNGQPTNTFILSTVSWTSDRHRIKPVLHIRCG